MNEGFFQLPPPPPPERVVHYTARQVDILLNLYYRPEPRPMPYPLIAKAMGVPNNPEALERLRWGYVTGYTDDKLGKRKVYVATAERIGRAGWPWQKREDDDLELAFLGDGALRSPPVDFTYLAAILARRTKEVAQRWDETHKRKAL